jgi:hypothetical protein
MRLGKYLPLSMLSDLEVEFWVGPTDEDAAERGTSAGIDGSSRAATEERREGVVA